MKSLLLLLLPAILLWLPSATRSTPATAPAEATVWEVDPVHSSMVFRVQHIGATYFYGRFNTIHGKLTLDEAKPAASSVTITVEADSIDTANEKRNGHLKSPDFFDVKQFPEITFASDKVEKLGDGVYRVSGQLELHGVKNPLTMEVHHTGDGEFQGRRSGWETTFTIQRSDWGMSYGVEQGVLGDEVRVTFGLELIEK